MTRDEALSALADSGQDYGSDYHDGLEGYFGWSINDDVLEIGFDHFVGDENAKSGWVSVFDKYRYKFRLVPIEGDD